MCHETPIDLMTPLMLAGLQLGFREHSRGATVLVEAHDWLSNKQRTTFFFSYEYTGDPGSSNRLGWCSTQVVGWLVG